MSIGLGEAAEVLGVSVKGFEEAQFSRFARERTALTPSGNSFSLSEVWGGFMGRNERANY